MPVTTAALATVPLCPIDELPVGLGRSFIVGERHIAVFRSRSGRVFAVDGTCPHRQGPLADGMLVGEQVVCPLHAFRFHSETGACDQFGACSVETYAVEVRDGLAHLLFPLE